jgi:hypothetical protein
MAIEDLTLKDNIKTWTHINANNVIGTVQQARIVVVLSILILHYNML